MLVALDTEFVSQRSRLDAEHQRQFRANPLKRAFELLNVSNKKMFMAYICDNNTIELLIEWGSTSSKGFSALGRQRC